MKHFETSKKEDAKSILRRWALNLFPAIRRTGGRVTFISTDLKEIHVRLSLNWKTRNYVGTVFGGSIYASVDPFYMIQLMQILGKNFIVWDKAAHIQFKRPVDKTVYARFLITDDLLEEIKRHVESDGKYTVDIPVNFQDKEGIVYAEINKTLYIASKSYYKSRKQQRSVDQ